MTLLPTLAERRVHGATVAALAALVAAACTGTPEPPDTDGADATAAPPVTRVLASQPGSVTQTIAEAEISVHYSRPVARGRELFGHLVPWGQEWAPGADHATYLTTTADIRVGGVDLPAGRYSIWMRPDPEAWTVYFHRDWDVFHLPFPGKDGVAAELTLTPGTAPHMETLAFYFPVVDGRHGVLAFQWGETRLDIPIDVGESGTITPRPPDAPGR